MGENLRFVEGKSEEIGGVVFTGVMGVVGGWFLLVEKNEGDVGGGVLVFEGGGWGRVEMGLAGKVGGG